MLTLWRRPGQLFLVLAVTLPLVAAGDGQSSSHSADGSVLFEQIPVVETASLHSQSLEEAPANVTVITARDIRRYGYRTLADVLAGVRGFYVSYDHEYHSVGVRGFSIPGDYNTRFLVMLNGHYLTENIYGSNNFFGQDFGLDMDLVERIEIVRGPSSALYGSNGIFATINIITKSPVDEPAAALSTETGSYGEKKVLVTSSSNLGHGANLLVSASLFNNGGKSFYFPEFDDPSSNHGRAIGVDGEKGYHFFGNLIWRGWSFLFYANAREKNLPTGVYGTLFDDPGTHDVDSRNFVEAAYARDFGSRGHLRWRLYYDQYRFHGRYDYALDEGIEDNRDLGLGDWAGSQLTYQLDTSRAGILTFGTELNADIRTIQQNYDVSPTAVQYLSLNNPARSAAIFVQDEYKLGDRWKLYLGARVDKTWGFDPFVSPRVALIHQRSANTVYKLMYGRGFRNPNAYERYYDDHGLSQTADPLLRPEKAHSLEVDVEHKLTPRVNLIATGYYYWLDDLIQAVPVDGVIIQYQNAMRTRAQGLEFEVNGHPWRSVETVASLSLQRAVNLANGQSLVNSPGRIAQFRAGTPLFRKLDLGGSLRYLNSLYALDRAVLPGAYVTDLTLSTVRLHPNFDVQGGVRNLFDRRYVYPAGFSVIMDAIPADGRTVYLKLTWHTGE